MASTGLNYNNMMNPSGLMTGGVKRRVVKKPFKKPVKKPVKKAVRRGGDEFLFYDGNNVKDANLYNIDTGVKNGGNVLQYMLDKFNTNMRRENFNDLKLDNNKNYNNASMDMDMSGGKKRATKVVKAKRPLTDYQKFMKTTLKNLKAQHSTKKQSELMKMGAKMWNQHKNR